MQSQNQPTVLNLCNLYFVFLKETACCLVVPGSGCWISTWVTQQNYWMNRVRGGLFLLLLPAHFLKAGEYCLRENPNGVDLNRNWDEKWDLGTSDSADQAHGQRPFSELLGIKPYRILKHENSRQLKLELSTVSVGKIWEVTCSHFPFLCCLCKSNLSQQSHTFVRFTFSATCVFKTRWVFCYQSGWVVQCSKCPRPETQMVRDLISHFQPTTFLSVPCIVPRCRWSCS